MIINEKLIQDIFNLKIKLSDKDKIKLSEYEEYIPMYDIYSQQIYPIFKKNLHYRLIESHYRFVTDEIKDWMEKKYNDCKEIDKPKSLIFKKNLDIISNYDLKMLTDTSYKVLYKYSKELGLQVSICKRKSFHPFFKHLKPYYTKTELIKLGENMNILKEEIDIESLNEKEIHYSICIKISENDVSFDEIKNHSEEIIDKNIISWITFYSFIGSFIFNVFLRKTKFTINSYILNGLKKLINVFKTSKPLEKDYVLYRFIWNDTFIKNLQAGEKFIDNGFTSSTRDPFYSPGINGTFGLILLKIHIPKNTPGIGFFIENFSLFPNEEEFLFSPFSEFLIISKNDNFKYYHTNPSFEKLINKKYELKYVGCKYDNISYYNYTFKDNIKTVNFETYEARGVNKLEMLHNFIEDSDQINIKLKNKLYKMTFQWFDGSDNSSYSKLYGNKIKEGINFNIFTEDGYPYINIELGDSLIVNYINTKYFYKNEKKELTDDEIDLIFYFGKIFYYSTARIYNTYRNFSEFKNNYDSNIKMFLYNNFYNHTIYNYAKNKIKEFGKNNYIKLDFGWYNLDIVLNKKMPEYIIDKLKLKYTTVRENIIDVVENNFIIYNKLFNMIKDDVDLCKVFDKKIDFIGEDYLTFHILNKQIIEFKNINYIKNMPYSDHIVDPFYKLIFDQPVRRY